LNHVNLVRVDCVRRTEAPGKGQFIFDHIHGNDEMGIDSSGCGDGAKAYAPSAKKPRPKRPLYECKIPETMFARLIVRS
jgi:hypothetical protein